MKKYYCIYVNAPNCASEIVAIFPEVMKKEAKECLEQGKGYYSIKIANWSGYGKLPKVHEAFDIKS